MKCLTGFLFTLSVLCACNNEGQTVIDAGRDTTIVITTGKALPNMLSLRILGSANDTFIIQGYYRIPGGRELDTTIKTDWYNDKFPIKYQAHKATMGRLTIRYSLN
jgi:hypothetical protein